MKKHIFSIIISFLFSFTMCIYAPLCTYWYGVNEFPFTAGSLFNSMLLPFIILWIVVFILLRLLSMLSGSKPCNVLGREMQISMPDVLLLACIIALWFEGSLLNKGLPAITGQANLFDSIPRLILSTAAWLAILLGGIVVWKKAVKFAVFLTAITVVMLLTGLGDAYRSAEEKVPVSITADQVFEDLSFHSEDNIIVIVSDAFPTYMAERILQSRPGLAAELEGFILLKNNLASGGQTSFALPAMLQGAVYEGDDYLAFVERVFTSSGSIPRLFSDSGRNTYITSLLPRFCALFTDRDHASHSLSPAVKLDMSVYTSLLFKFLPYALKQSFEPIVVAQIAGTKVLASKASANTSNSWFRNRLIDKLDNNSSIPTGHFHHYYGVHVPYSFNAEGKPLPAQERSTESGLQAACEWELRCFVDFLNELKVRGMYDGATIVLVGDHGSGRLKIEDNDITFTSTDTPLFLVKPQNTRQSFEYSNAPTSNVLLPELVKKAHEGRQAFVNFLSDLPSERKIFRQPDQLFAVLGTDLDTLLFNKLDIDVKLKPTILRLGQEYTFSRGAINLPLAVPSQVSNIVLSGGDGMTLSHFTKGSILELTVDHVSSKVDIFLSSYFAQYRDLHTAAFVSLTITDLFSGEILYNKEEKLPIDEKGVKLDSILENVTIKDKKIRLAFKSNSLRNCMYVIKGIKIGGIEELKPTMLRLGQEYTFNRTANNNLPLAIPIQAQNFCLDGGMGMDFTNFKKVGLLEIAVDHAPGKIDIFLSNFFEQYKDLHTVALVSLTITDLFSGEILYNKKEKLPISQNWVVLDSILKNVTIKDKKIRLAFKSNSPYNCWYVLRGIKIGGDEK